jgi:hypothetical protein
MFVLLIIGLIVLGFSLFLYVDNEEWNFLNANLLYRSLFEDKNKQYGAFQLRKNSAGLLTTIIFVFIIATAGLITLKKVDLLPETNLANIANDVTDTTVFVLNNVQNTVETPPSAFNHQGNNGDNQPVAQNGSASEEDGESERPQTTSTNSTTPKENASTSGQKPNKRTSAEQSIYDFERQLKESAGGNAERERIQKEWDERKRQRENKEKQKPAITGGNGGVAGTNSGVDGKTLVTWDLDGRKAHQDDNSNVKIPGYTCGKGINAKVTVRVKVNANGDVIFAKSIAPEGTNSCCVDKAEAYAKKSRFEYASKSLQEGTITYTFKSQ